MYQKTIKITKLYAYITKKDGMEGILGIYQTDGQCLPLVSLDMEDIYKLKPSVDALSKEKGLKYEIRQFQRILA